MKTVLIVEDEKMIRQGIKTMIMRSGVPIETIMECNNGETALEILKEQEIDVMFTDIRMPKMDGITVLKNIRAQGKLDVLFERFYRLDSSRNSGTGGSGIGLSVAKAIVQAHKGKISAENRKRTDDHSSFIIESDYVIQPPDEGKKYLSFGGIFVLYD